MVMGPPDKLPRLPPGRLIGHPTSKKTTDETAVLAPVGGGVHALLKLNKLDKLDQLDQFLASVEPERREAIERRGPISPLARPAERDHGGEHPTDESKSNRGSQ
jgi:hypothetical protein